MEYETAPAYSIWMTARARLLAALKVVLTLFTLAVLGLAVLFGLIIWPGIPMIPATPPLLQHVTSPGGWMSEGCPWEPWMMGGRIIDEALSPELMARLQADFPPDSEAAKLQSMLLSQGFRMISPCIKDPSIQRATFSQIGGGLIGPYPMSATVAWKAARDRIVWTKGFVHYHGL